MKPRKPKLAHRNPVVVPAKLCHAGAHGKTGKAKRRAEKMETSRSLAEWLGNRLLPGTRLSSNLTGPTNP